MTKYFSPARTARGFTLVELMVAIAIGLFLSAVTGTVYLNSKNMFNYQDAMSRLQENARFAMERISRDVRMAGFSTCGSLGGSVANTVNGGTTNWWLNLGAPIMGFDNISTPPSMAPNAAPGTDAFYVLGVGGGDISVISHNAQAATIQTTQHSIKPGSILVITDCSQTSVFQMSGPTNANNNATNINHDTGNNASPGNCNKQLGANCPTAKAYTYSPGATVLQLSAASYFIAPSTNLNSGNSLWTCSLENQTGGTTACVELINNVEDMQVQYGVDTDADQSINAYLDAGNVTNWASVLSVRVNLLLATPPSAGNLSSKAQTYTFNSQLVSAQDRRVRRTYSSVINLRNRTK